MDAVATLAHLSPDAVAGSADFPVFPVVGSFAGARCPGKCGPLVSIDADRGAEQSGSRREDTLASFAVRQHLRSDSGRTVGYAAVGALSGLLGGVAFTSIDAVVPAGDGVRGATGILIGLSVLAGGVSYLVRGTHAPIPEHIPAVSSLFNRVSGHLASRIDGLAGSPRIAGPGMVRAVLPCSIIYPASLSVFAIGAPVRGGLALGVLGLGTIPTRLAYGTMLGTPSTKRRIPLHRGLDAAFLLLGYSPHSRGLASLGFDVPRLDIPHRNVPHLDVQYYQPLA